MSRPVDPIRRYAESCVMDRVETYRELEDMAPTFSDALDRIDANLDRAFEREMGWVL